MNRKMPADLKFLPLGHKSFVQRMGAAITRNGKALAKKSDEPDLNGVIIDHDKFKDTITVAAEAGDNAEAKEEVLKRILDVLNANGSVIKRYHAPIQVVNFSVACSLLAGEQPTDACQYRVRLVPTPNRSTRSGLTEAMEATRLSRQTAQARKAEQKQQLHRIEAERRIREGAPPPREGKKGHGINAKLSSGNASASGSGNAAVLKDEIGTSSSAIALPASDASIRAKQLAETGSLASTVHTGALSAIAALPSSSAIAASTTLPAFASRSDMSLLSVNSSALPSAASPAFSASDSTPCAKPAEVASSSSGAIVADPSAPATAAVTGFDRSVVGLSTSQVADAALTADSSGTGPHKRPRPLDVVASADRAIKPRLLGSEQPQVPTSDGAVEAEGEREWTVEHKSELIRSMEVQAPVIAQIAPESGVLPELYTSEQVQEMIMKLFATMRSII